MELAQEQLDRSLEAIAAKYQADEEAYKEQYLETVKEYAFDNYSVETTLFIECDRESQNTYLRYYEFGDSEREDSERIKVEVKDFSETVQKSLNNLREVFNAHGNGFWQAIIVKKGCLIFEADSRAGLYLVVWAESKQIFKENAESIFNETIFPEFKTKKIKNGWSHAIRDI